VRNLIFIDETGVNLSMTRRYGRCSGGGRVYAQRPGNQGQNVILVGAMSNEGLIATMTLPGGMNTASFLVYLERILLPQLWKEAIIVMDNLPVHHAKTVETLIKFFGVNVKFLPPYSPDLSPIELCWSRIKGIMRSEAARSSETLDAAITKAINGITDENALHGFNHCSLFLEPIR